jgi:hypothetical protein
VDLLQELQPEEVPAKGFSTPLIPKRESFLFTSSEPHSGHFAFCEPKIRSSKSLPHEPQLYSNMGMVNYSTKAPRRRHGAAYGRRARRRRGAAAAS